MQLAQCKAYQNPRRKAIISAIDICMAVGQFGTSDELTIPWTLEMIEVALSVGSSTAEAMHLMGVLSLYVLVSIGSTLTCTPVHESLLTVLTPCCAALSCHLYLYIKYTIWLNTHKDQTWQSNTPSLLSSQRGTLLAASFVRSLMTSAAS